MGFLDFIRAVAALAVTLGLVGLAAVVVRRYAPDLIARLQTGAGKAERRLQVLESLVLDPSRRLVLVRFDQEERLILLGDGHLLDGAAPPRRTAAPPAPRKGLVV
jgi:flagellar protein FliO/FliZ